MSFERVVTQQYICDTDIPPNSASSLSTFNFGDLCTSTLSLRKFFLVNCDQFYNEDTGYWDANNILWKEILTADI